MYRNRSHEPRIGVIKLVFYGRGTIIVVLEGDVLVLFKDGLCNIVQFDDLGAEINVPVFSFPVPPELKSYPKNIPKTGGD